MKKIFTLIAIVICTVTFAQDKIYMHTATTENSSSDITYINHPDLNGNPNAPIVYSHVWNPNGETGIYNDNNTTLYYSDAEQKWSIANEDFSDIVIGSHYNIYIAANPDLVTTHVATAANQGMYGDYTTKIDDPGFNNNNPGPYAIVSNYYNANNVANNETYNFYYDTATDQRGIYSANGSAIPENAGFRILRYDDDATVAFSHVTNGANITGNYTIIDNPFLNGNPDATFVFSHYWGISGNNGNTPSKLGAWYNGSNWSIYIESNADTMEEEVTFDIIVADQEILGNEDFVSETKITMFPNPAIESTTITSTQEITSITIFNILGQEVATFKGEGNNTQIDVSNFTTGTYFVKIQAQDKTETLKLIKQ